MKLGIKKLHENEWQLHIGNAMVKLDPFSLALLNITLEHALALQHGDHHSTLASYVALGLRMKHLKPLDLQKLIRELDNKDLLMLMNLVEDKTLNQMIMDNVGGILAKQLESDMQGQVAANEEEAKSAIRRVIETMFALEANGKIEVLTEETRYI